MGRLPDRPGLTNRQGQARATDVAYAALIMMAGLYPLELGQATGLLFLALPAAYIAFHPERAMPLLAWSTPLLLLVGFSFLSSGWSPVPATTAYYTVQLGVTILCAAMLGAGTPAERLIDGLFIAFFIHGCSVFAYGLWSHELSVFSPGENGYMGLAGSKNTCSDMAWSGLLLAQAKLRLEWQRVRVLGVLAVLFLVALDLVIVLRSQSAGANAAGVVATLVYTALFLIARFPPAWRSTLIALVATAVGLAVATRKIWYDSLLSGFLQVAGKDSTLTGRTYIWERAQVLVNQRPLLGQGYSAFWRQGNLEPEAIWDAMYVENRVGFNFHNSIYEILVSFGYVGLALFAVVFAYCIIRLLARFVGRPSAMTPYYLAMIAYYAMRFNFESLPLAVFSHNMLILYGALSHGLAGRLPAPIERRSLRAAATV